HAIDDLLNVVRIVGEERYAPLGVVEAGRTRDELKDFAVVLPAHSAMTAHQAFALVEGQRKPILFRRASLRHRIEAEDFPYGEKRIEFVLAVFGHARPELAHASLEFGRSRKQILLALQRPGELFVAGNVFALLSER